MGECINSELEKMRGMTDKVEIVRRVCALIDREIHLGYLIYPVNYIAYDKLNDTTRFKANLPDITPEERGYMREQILIMYSNPLRNKLHASGEDM